MGAHKPGAPRKDVKPIPLAQRKLVPAVGILGESRTLYPDHTESLSCGRLHHDPALKTIHDLSSQLLQASHLGGNVVGLNV